MWVGLDWIGLGWVGLGWEGLDWIGLDWLGLGWIGLGWVSKFYRNSIGNLLKFYGECIEITLQQTYVRNIQLRTYITEIVPERIYYSSSSMFVGSSLGVRCSLEFQPDV